MIRPRPRAIDARPDPRAQSQVTRLDGYTIDTQHCQTGPLQSNVRASEGRGFRPAQECLLLSRRALPSAVATAPVVAPTVPVPLPGRDRRTRPTLRRNEDPVLRQPRPGPIGRSASSRTTAPTCTRTSAMWIWWPRPSPCGPTAVRTANRSAHCRQERSPPSLRGSSPTTRPMAPVELPPWSRTATTPSCASCPPCTPPRTSAATGNSHLDQMGRKGRAQWDSASRAGRGHAGDGRTPATPTGSPQEPRPVLLRLDVAIRPISPVSLSLPGRGRRADTSGRAGECAPASLHCRAKACAVGSAWAVSRRIPCRHGEVSREDEPPRKGTSTAPPAPRWPLPRTTGTAVSRWRGSTRTPPRGRDRGDGLHAGGAVDGGRDCQEPPRHGLGRMTELVD